MSKFATESRFGNYDVGTVGSWFSPAYDDPIRKEQWVERAGLVQLHGGNLTYAASKSDGGSKVLVAGCGFGYLCWELWNLGLSAWGADIAWPITKGKGGKLPNISDHIFEADCTSTTAIGTVKSQAGIGKNGKFALGITDDLLSAADDAANVSAMLTALRANCTRLLHFITCYNAGDPKSGRLPDGTTPDWLAMSQSAWRTLIGPTDVIVDLAGNRLVA